jgi:hypothetical protein
MLHAGVSIPQIFLVAGILNIVVTSTLFMLLPEFWQRFAIWLRLKAETQNQ